MAFEGVTNGPDMAEHLDAADHSDEIRQMPPAEPAQMGPPALLLIQHAPRRARFVPDGAVTPPEDQDRGLWNGAMIDKAMRGQPDQPRGVGARWKSLTEPLLRTEALDRVRPGHRIRR